MAGLNLKNLKGASTKGMDAIPAGAYDAVIYKAEETAIKADTTGKLPPGTPGVAIQFKVEGGEFDNRRVFTRYWLPGDDYEDKSKTQTMLDMFASFLKAVGYDPDEITSGKFVLDLEDLEDRQCRITVKVSESGYNEVSAVRPPVEAGVGGSLL